MGCEMAVKLALEPRSGLQAANEVANHFQIANHLQVAESPPSCKTKVQTWKLDNSTKSNSEDFYSENDWLGSLSLGVKKARVRWSHLIPQGVREASPCRLPTYDTLMHVGTLGCTG
uniref:Uncharacterized protein n=1 Tax=Vitis vinifera TaxID=29760 RepID=A5AKZ3_VITVI|nr:hypothetical protein VITISV_026298 [Vitis vinifera]